ncbi:MAG: OmpH family outer membrane protein [Verrucomicrobia bacterium]|nr:OmpH family outer membrane protein [Verrucomicrobiota bacterium]
MTATLCPALLAACLLAAFSLPARAQGKIAIIDLQKVFDKYYKTQAASAKLKQRMADLDKEQNALIAQRQKAADDYKQALEQANDMAVSIEEREKRKKIAETKLREVYDTEQSLTQFRAQASTSVEEEDRRMRENIIAEIRAVVSAKGKAAGYGLILDVAGASLSRVPVVVYHSGQIDLTDEVLAQLNANAPPAGAPK